MRTLKADVLHVGIIQRPKGITLPMVTLAFRIVITVGPFQIMGFIRAITSSAITILVVSAKTVFMFLEFIGFHILAFIF